MVDFRDGYTATNGAYTRSGPPAALELALEKRADAVISLFDGFGVRNRKALHMARELIICWSAQQMIAVGHKTVDDCGAKRSIHR
jgi:hypothetical protein